MTYRVAEHGSQRPTSYAHCPTTANLILRVWLCVDKNTSHRAAEHGSLRLPSRARSPPEAHPFLRVGRLENFIPSIPASPRPISLHNTNPAHPVDQLGRKLHTKQASVTETNQPRSFRQPCQPASCRGFVDSKTSYRARMGHQNPTS